jgi:S-adenosylmethionine:tRNA ribosyltransferase-isomerase
MPCFLLLRLVYFHTYGVVALSEIDTTELLIEDFEYDLPPQLIAQEPSAVRHESRLLCLDRRSGEVAHHSFKEIIDLLRPGDLIVANDTRVIPARLVARRATGGIIKILLLKPEASKPGLWLAMGTPLRRLKAGEKITILGPVREYDAQITEFVTGQDGHKRLLLDLGSQENSFKILSEVGFAPLPPYIHRLESSRAEMQENLDRAEEESNFGGLFNAEDESIRVSDIDRYQTVFAKQPGAVAAPTAGLHFSREIVESLLQKGVDMQYLTLHVGPGTFKPIATDVDKHTIEAEQFSISQSTADAINQAKAQGRRIIAVGTTSCRALESAAADGKVRAIENGSTSLYIKPGFTFQILDGLITNFHLSKSSLLVLVSAFAGRDNIMNAYKVAVQNRYRFFSYGDAMLIL